MTVHATGSGRGVAWAGYTPGYNYRREVGGVARAREGGMEGGRERGAPASYLEYLPNLWLEAHVEHSVGFVKHQVTHLRERHGPHLQEVVEAAGSGNDDRHPVADFPQLPALGGPTVDAGGHDATRAPKLHALGLDLVRQFCARNSSGFRLGWTTARYAWRSCAQSRPFCFVS